MLIYKNSIEFNSILWSFKAFAINLIVGLLAPLKPRLAERLLPSGDFGPVDFSQGFQRLIRAAFNARCSRVLT